jgi:hypothetical protein
MRQYPNRHVDHDYKQESYYRCYLQYHINLMSKSRL